MKLGCHVSALKNPRKAPYEEAIERAGQLGFEGVELIAMDRAELDDYYTPARTTALRRLAQEQGLEISQFAVFSTACEGMASLDPAAVEAGLEVFAQGVRVARDLGAPLVNLVSHWPIGLKTPIAYPPTYIYPIVRGVQQVASPKLEMTLPAGADFDAIWRNYVLSLRRAADLAADAGIRLTIEGHAHVIVSGTDALLRLFDQLPHRALAVNFDTSWHFLQREYLPMSILKLGGRIAQVHCRDGDGLLNYGLPPGQGIIDWRGVLRALRDTGFDGFLTLEISGFRDQLEIAADARAYLARMLERL
jgi:sugar phosphate isomerase/epimerase